MGRIAVLAGQLAVLVASLAASAAEPADPLDWPMWRGPQRDGTSRETGLVDKWSPGGENLLWAKKEYGTRSTPIYMRGKLYFLALSEPETPRAGERVVCADAASGNLVWENKFKVFLSDVPYERVGWSSVVGDPETGNVYALGVGGFFQCIDGASGKTLWSHSMSEEYGLLSTYGGRTNFPIIFEDLVLVNGVMIGWGEYARPNHRYVAFDKKTGAAVWIAGTRPLPDDTTYSTPIACVLKGQAAIVFGAGDGGVYALQPRTGKQIWKYDFSRRGINITPVVEGDTVYMCHSEENYVNTTMGAIAAIRGDRTGDITKDGALWRVFDRTVGKSSPLLVHGRLYVIDDGATMFILDAKTGKQIGKQKLGTMMRGSPVYADGKIFTCDATGRWYVLAPTDQGVRILHRLKLPGTAPEVHASPIISHGRIYLASTEAMYSIGRTDGTSPNAPAAPEPPRETPAEDDPKPAQLQIVPVEVLMRPGETQAFELRLFNSRGQFLKKTEGKFSVDAGGTVDATGKFQSAAEHGHHATIVTAEAEGLKAQARVRVVPPLPWKFDFEKGDVPVTWVGMRYRHVLRDVGGNKVMVKVTTIPKGTRSQGWMGPVDLHDYTIQADVQGQQKDGKLPDIGLIAQRYTLDLMGVAQKLQIRTWTPVLHEMSKTIDCAWKPGVWYTMKFRAANQDGKALLQGKVWPRDEKEPEAWCIDYTYESPNTTGSPGLFGNATNAEIFLDNIRVTPNEPESSSKNN